jgi:cytochrome P450
MADLAVPHAPDLYWDPYDYELHVDPYPTWKRLRDEAPAYYNDKLDFWALTRYEDVKAASVDPNLISGRGTQLELIENPEAFEAVRSMMIFMDPPDHTHMRALASRVFTPRRVAQLEGQVRDLCARYLDPAVGSDGFDVVADFGAKLPMMVISAFLGVPEEDRDAIRVLADLQLARDEDEKEFRTEPLLVMVQYFAAAVAIRRVSPRDDFITALSNTELAEEDGSTRPLTDDELVRFITLLSIAGNETVARLIGWAGATLARFPDQRQLLVDDPSLIPNAVEELLRFEPPSPVQFRYADGDVTYGGKVIHAGSKVALLTGSAGRDERQYPDADRFDVRRKIDGHVTFGYGAHYCLGAALARLEGRVAVEELLRRFPAWDVDWDRAEMIHTSSVRGWDHLPIRPL